MEEINAPPRATPLRDPHNNRKVCCNRNSDPNTQVITWERPPSQEYPEEFLFSGIFTCDQFLAISHPAKES
ncbi:hypothetical protein THOM_1587 [Trachipleistophora hominis]|uniref:Uncharacterized protein n=1 Tax=Trachipleistophora hominis TaxID=72359 RepID=L7JWM9_TRAHO|nr:hypothetical protein THOM_1587 [Trachipleistophora hominis]